MIQNSSNIDINDLFKIPLSGKPHVDIQLAAYLKKLISIALAVVGCCGIIHAKTKKALKQFFYQNKVKVLVDK